MGSSNLVVLMLRKNPCKQDSQWKDFDQNSLTIITNYPSIRQLYEPATAQYEEPISTEAYKQRKSARSQNASLTFIIPYTALQMMPYKVGASSLDMTLLTLVPRTSP
jgi:hypothetical protein